MGDEILLRSPLPQVCRDFTERLSSGCRRRRRHGVLRPAERRRTFGFVERGELCAGFDEDLQAASDPDQTA
jgi:hypothetical protein